MNTYERNKTLFRLLFLAPLVSVFVLLQSCQQQKIEAKFVGYIEADYRYVSSLQSGLIIKQYVKPGDEISQGDVVFELGRDLIQLKIKEVKARIIQAKSMLADSQNGLRKDEIDSLKAQLNESETIMDLKQKELDRTIKLLKQGLIAQSFVDVINAEFESAQAKVNTFKAKIRAANLPARDGVINSAKANVLIIEQQLLQLQWTLSQHSIQSHFAGKVFDVYFEQGENIKAGQPLLALIPNNELTVKFFVQQTMLSQMQLGKSIYVYADGFTQPFEAKISYIATSAQFTPPVIYSKNSREKMVFKLEAIFENKALIVQLPLGLPVDITLTK
ncbi:MAG: HlyD family efflux transporter periplasmic adaptor subunit [Saccharospirillaceae bacterium]|nr:HlyD family efflux transporter periplasmic adaptor subunit [Pseudomonadales bacterium]NRB79811.1 HlyD family efflux transporter periplasmic adaptor subunit [Saccharospirillaceae bacterium]